MICALCMILSHKGLGWYSNDSQNRQITTFIRMTESNKLSTSMTSREDHQEDDILLSSHEKPLCTAPEHLPRIGQHKGHLLVAIQVDRYASRLKLHPINLLQSSRHYPTSHSVLVDHRQSIPGHPKLYAFQTLEKRRSCCHGCGW